MARSLEGIVLPSAREKADVAWGMIGGSGEVEMGLCGCVRWKAVGRPGRITKTCRQHRESIR